MDCDTAIGDVDPRTVGPVQAWTTTRDVGVRGPLAPGPAVAERRDDVLPAEHAPDRHGAMAWTGALVASVARTGWLAAVVTVAFLGGALAATAASGRSLTAALPWAFVGGGLWLVISLTWTLIRRP
ncbi:MAG TPA: hypothetical protein VG076_03805 [Acidimicrobiales bacterium]|nr:hypothetical protein [Acidimicrobiales bacterium]